MTVPDFQALMLPVLQLATDGAEHRTGDVIEALGMQLGLTAADREELLPGGSQRRFNNRIYWAAAHLRAAGLIVSGGRGRFSITEAGRAALETKPPIIDMKFLAAYPGYQEFKTGSAGHDTSIPAPAEAGTGEQTPEELIASAVQLLDDQLAAEILARVKSEHFTFFEGLVVHLLLQMGYGGALGSGTTLGRSGDGGVDGVIQQDKLGLDSIYVQAKRWTDKQVSRPDVQAFSGSLGMVHASKGVFITTSTFSGEARGYVKAIGKHIVLIDGKQLARLMIEHNVGVSEHRRYTLKRVDSDFFETEP
jgi:restriction system protein